MMEFRLVLVFDVANHLRLEVCKEMGQKSLAPFNRKITFFDLLSSGISNNRELLVLINHSGILTQPFDISPKLIPFDCSMTLFRNEVWSYIYDSSKKSYKKTVCPIKTFMNGASLTKGKCIGGELYLSDMNASCLCIFVAFRYESALNYIIPINSKIPFITTDGKLYVRDLQAESTLLKTLGQNYNYEKCILSISYNEIDKIADFVSNGWKLFAQTSKQKYTSLYLHREKSGVNWFSSSENEQLSYSKQLLDGFLNSRNFKEIGSKIVFFNRDDIEKVPNSEIYSDFSVKICNPNIFDPAKLSGKDKSKIVNCIEKYVQAKLRPYQIEGVFWLFANRLNDCNCLLADDMGLGKTLQVISYLSCIETKKDHLVIAPTSLLFNWHNEVVKFAPHLLSKITFVSYDILRLHLEDYLIKDYDTVVVDEAQIIKNSKTKKYGAISKLKRKCMILLTGTPLENSIEEIWTHFLMLMPELAPLHKRLAIVKKNNGLDNYVKLTGMLLSPFVLRRTKQEVLNDLPLCIEKNVYVQMSGIEMKIYTRIHSMINNAISQGVSGRINSIA